MIPIITGPRNGEQASESSISLRPLPPLPIRRCSRGALNRRRADDFAEVAGRELLPDAEASWGRSTRCPCCRCRSESLFAVDGLKGSDWIESLMNLTEPSQKPTLAPPGWKLPTI